MWIDFCVQLFTNVENPRLQSAKGKNPPFLVDNLQLFGKTVCKNPCENVEKYRPQ